MDTKRQNGVVILFFTLIFSQFSYANVGGYTNLVAGATGVATTGLLAAVFGGSKSSAPSDTPDDILTEEIPLQIEAGVPLQVEAGVPSQFTIVNRENIFSGNRVYLRSTLGPVKPNYIDLKKGEKKKVGVIFSELGKNNRLEFHGVNDKGNKIVMYSKVSFEVVDKNKQIPKHAVLVGKIVDSNNHLPIVGATVKILNNESSEEDQNAYVETDKNGAYRFDNIFPGSFNLEVRKNGYHSMVKKTIVAAKRTISANVALSCTCNANGKVPVLLVPGIMGSYSKEKAPLLWPYPRLSPVSPNWDSGELEMLDPFGQVGWGKVTKALQQHGYSKDCTIFTVPYDWSLSVPDIRDKYLKPWIDEAKKRSGSDKVDIIAHSMGGLVTRSYIQSNLYENDVRKFAMVGVPSKGAGGVYPIWEAGDSIEADVISGNTGIANPTAYFYTNTLSYFYSDRNWSNVCKFGEIRRYEPSSCDKNKAYEFAHKYALSSGQLMPIYDDALFDKDSGKNAPIQKHENQFLKSLNGLNCSSANGCVDERGKEYVYKKPLDIFTSDVADVTKVYAKLFGGFNHDTIGSIYVTKSSDSILYEDGVPQNISKESGDGTVLPKSVNINDYLSPDKPLELIQKHSEHSALIGVFTKEIIEFIAGASFNLKALEMIKTAPQKTLVISISGRAQPHIHSVLAIDNSIKTEDSLKLEKEHKMDATSLVVKDPSDGRYNIAIDSVHHENYELSISYYDEATNKLSAQRYLGYFDGSTKSFAFTLNNKNPNGPIIFDRSFSTPSELTLEKSGNKILLVWQDKIGVNKNDVDHYEVYWKEDTEPYMHLLGKATERSYLTDHSWHDRSINSYAVRAILKDGSSTFMSQLAFFIAEEDKVSLKK